MTVQGRSVSPGMLRFVLVVGLLVLALAAVAFVPPLGAVRHAVWTPVPRIPASENAWEPYLAGLRDLAREPLPPWLPTATDAVALTRDQEAYLDRHGAALEALQEGAARPQARFFTEPITVSTRMPHPVAVRGLAQLAAAEAHRRRGSGRSEEAWPLELAAYRLGADVAEPGTGFVVASLAIGCRHTAATGLFRAVARGDLATASYGAIARGVSRADGRMPSPYDAAAGEWDMVGRSIEAYYLRDRVEGAVRQPEARPGLRADALRARVLDSFFRQHRAVLDVLRPPLLGWDLPALGELDARKRTVPSVWRWPFYIESAAGELLRQVVSPVGQMTRMLYVDRANGAALQALAALRAYRAVHGAWPAEVGPALAELGLAVPHDPQDGRAIRYRLAPAGPVLWFLGIDGHDDLGLREYDDALQRNAVAGTDLVYRMGEVPRLLR